MRIVVSARRIAVKKVLGREVSLERGEDEERRTFCYCAGDGERLFEGTSVMITWVSLRSGGVRYVVQ